MDSAGVSYCCLGWVLPSDVGSGKREQYSTNCAAPSWLRQPRHLQDRNSLVPSQVARNGQVGPGIWLGLLQSCLEFCWLRASIVELIAFLLGCPNQLVTTQCLSSAVFPLIWIMQRTLFWPTQESQWFPLVSTM